MQKVIAIQPDDYIESDSSSSRWSRLLRTAGHEVRWVDVYSADILKQLEGCDAFMWRWAHFGGMFQIAERLLPVVERELGLVTYPDQKTCWHYDDKIAQAYLFDVLEVPTPKTWCWFTEASARAWVCDASFPLVLKLAKGAGSQNVRMVRSVAEANQWIKRLFGEGVSSFQEPSVARPWPWRIRIREAAKALLKGGPLGQAPPGWPLEKNYALFQEFLPDNGFDTRVTVIGKRAFAFRRFNRDGDFRASGSGKIDYAPEKIDERFVRTAFSVAKKLGSQSCATDGLYRQASIVVTEISYTYVSKAVHECPGHWRLSGNPEDGELVWQAGGMWPEQAQIEDFLDRLESQQK